MKKSELSNGTTVASPEEAACRLKKGGEVCVVQIGSGFKTYPIQREGHYKKVYGQENVHIVKGQA